MALTRSEVHNYTRKLYRFLRQGYKISFKHLRSYRGYIDKYPDFVVVTFDPRDDLLTTVIHEFLHHEHWDWSEAQVLRMERELMNSLTDRQVRNMIKRFAEAI
jgi:hypothetical protein